MADAVDVQLEPAWVPCRQTHCKQNDNQQARQASCTQGVDCNMAAPEAGHKLAVASRHIFAPPLDILLACLGCKVHTDATSGWCANADDTLEDASTNTANDTTLDDSNAPRGRFLLMSVDSSMRN